MSGEFHAKNSCDNDLDNTINDLEIATNSFTDDFVFKAFDVPYIFPGDPLFPKELKVPMDPMTSMTSMAPITPIPPITPMYSITPMTPMDPMDPTALLPELATLGCRIDHILPFEKEGGGGRNGGGRGSKWRSILPHKKEDMIQVKNETDTTICIVCTQDLVSVLDNGGAGLNAGAAGVDIRLDIAKALVGVKEIKSVLKLGPNESQDVLAASKYTTVSVFSIDGDTMKLLFKSALLKRGRRLTVEQRDVDYALNDHELAILDLWA